MPNCATASAFSGRGETGNGGHGRFDPDVVRARDAAADAHAFAVPGRAVVSRAARDGVHQVFAGERLHGREAFLGQPAIQHFEQALANERRMHDAAVEENVGGAGQAAGPRRTALCSDAAACWRRNFARWRVMAASERIGQAHFLQADAAGAVRHFSARRRAGRKPSSTCSICSRRSFALMVPPIRLEPLPRIVTGRFVGIRFGVEQLFFGEAAVVPERLQLEAVDLRAVRGQIAGDGVGQREIDVVAAEQDVFADGDAFQLQFAFAFGDGDQGEIGGAAADIDDQHEVAFA